MGHGRADEAGPSLARDVKEASAGNGPAPIKRSYFYRTEEVIKVESLFSTKIVFVRHGLLSASCRVHGHWSGLIPLNQLLPPLGNDNENAHRLSK